VDRAIDFDDKLSRGAIEGDDVGTYGVLATELEAGKPTASQRLPQDRLGSRG
jgi:hypothetical protein